MTAHAFYPLTGPAADTTIRIDRMVTRFGEVEYFVVDLRNTDHSGCGEVLWQGGDEAEARRRAEVAA